MVDYVLVQREIMNNVIGIKIITGEKRFAQHNLLVLDLLLQKNKVLARKPERVRI